MAAAIKAAIKLDLEVFANQRLQVRHESGDIVPFNFFPEQKYIYDVLQLLRDPQRNAPALIRVYKARRRGTSTIFVTDILHQILYSDKATHAQIYGHARTSGDTLFNVLRNFYESIPATERPEEIKHVDKHWLWKGHKEVHVHTIQGDGLSRGDATNYMLLTEVGSYRQADAIKDVLSGLTYTAGLTIAQESTSEGYDDYWYESHLEFKKLVNILSHKYKGQYKEPTRAEQLRGETVALRLLRSNLWPYDRYFHVFLPWFWNDENVLTDARALEEFRDTMTEYDKSIKILYNLSDPQLAWYRMRLNAVSGDMQKLHQEYPCCEEDSFVATGSSLFNKEVLTRLQAKASALPGLQEAAQKLGQAEEAYMQELNRERKLPRNVLLCCDLEYKVEPKAVGHMRFMDKNKAVVEPIVKSDNLGAWWIFDPPQETHKNMYVVSCDPAGGKETSDNSVILVFNRVHRKFVALFFGQVGGEDLAKELAKIGAMYNFAPILVERNAGGETVLNQLQARYVQVMRAGKSNKGFDDFTSTDLGIFMTNAAGQGVKHRAAEELKKFIEQEIPEDSDGSEIPFTWMLSEFGTFLKGKLKAEGNKHDDFVMAALIALEGDRILGVQGHWPTPIIKMAAEHKLRFETSVDAAPSSRCF